MPYLKKIAFKLAELQSLERGASKKPDIRNIENKNPLFL